MWHEARRQEKAVRHKMVDNARRHERRKQFYESVRRDPEEFMQVHGQKMLIHVDPSIAEAAESPNTLRKWQGDPTILIDRFDVRVHLEQISEVTNKKTKNNVLKDDIEELQCEYERYRILVFNEFCKANESSFLRQIAAKEFWPNQQTSASFPSTYKKEHEKKRNLANKRAAIAFTYGDSSDTIKSTRMQQQQNINEASSTDEEEDCLEEPEEIDPVIDPDALTAEQAAALNKIGTHYNVMSGVFLQLLNFDRKEQTSTAQIKEIDKAKLALSGRHAKADRAALKRRRAMIIGNLGSAMQNNEEATTTLLSFLAATNNTNLNEDSSSSESEEEFSKTEFITCFGGNDEKIGKKSTTSQNTINLEDEEDDHNFGIVHGPILPTKEYRRLLELSKRESESPESQWTGQRLQREKSNGVYRDKSFSRSPRNLHSSSPTRRRDCDYGYERRRQRSRSSSRDRIRRRSKGKREANRRRSTSSPRSPSTKRTHQVSASSSCRSKVHSSSSSMNTSRISSNRDVNGRGCQRSNSPSSISNHYSKKETIANTSRMTEDSQQQHHVSSGEQLYESSESDEDSLLSVHSSMSDSEKERIIRENRKRRIRRTKKMVKEQQTRSAESQENMESKVGKAAKKLRMQMHKALTETAVQLKEEEEQRYREAMRERKQREEELLEESRLLRKREREKRRLDEECEQKRLERNKRDNSKNRHRDKNIKDDKHSRVNNSRSSSQGRRHQRRASSSSS